MAAHVSDKHLAVHHMQGTAAMPAHMAALQLYCPGSLGDSLANSACDPCQHTGPSEAKSNVCSMHCYVCASMPSMLVALLTWCCLASSHDLTTCKSHKLLLHAMLTGACCLATALLVIRQHRW